MTTSANTSSRIRAAGAYVGEVLVRNVDGARWAAHPSYAAPVVALPSGRLADPVGRAHDRFEGDEHDSITTFVDGVLAQEARSTAGATGPGDATGATARGDRRDS